MMPFSVLRFWGLSILGWGLLATGAYLIYEWSNGISRAKTTVTKDVVDEQERAFRPEEANNPPRLTTINEQADNIGGPICLGAGIALLLTSSFGGLPWIMLLRNRNNDDPREFHSD